MWVLENLLGQVERTHGQVRGLYVDAAVVQQGNLNHVLGQVGGHLVGSRHFDKPL